MTDIRFHSINNRDTCPTWSLCQEYKAVSIATKEAAMHAGKVFGNISTSYDSKETKQVDLMIWKHTNSKYDEEDENM